MTKSSTHARRRIPILISACYFMAVTYASVTLCNQTIWAAKPWTPNHVSSDHWQGPISQTQLTDNSDLWYARTVVGSVMVYSKGEAKPKSFLHNRTYQTSNELITELLSDSDEQQWKLLRLTSVWRGMPLIADRNNSFLVIASPEDNLSNDADPASLKIVSRQTGKIVADLPWVPEMIDVQDIKLLPGNQGMLVLYDCKVEQIVWDDQMNIERILLPIARAQRMVFNAESNCVYVSHDRDHLCCYSLKDRRFLWDQCFESRLWISALTVDALNHRLLFGLPNGNLMQADLETGKMEMILFSGEGIGSLAIDDQQKLYIGLYNGCIEQWDSSNLVCQFVYRVSSRNDSSI